MSTVAILYIATGIYKDFWQIYYPSFEKNFLTDCQREYFVFTDEPEFFSGLSNVHPGPIPALPWPLPTLLRYHFFLERQNELSDFDYILFTNANLRCNCEISSSEILPRKELGEHFVFAQHGGYVTTPRVNLPFERRNFSTAYVSPEKGKTYIMGGFNGGEAAYFLEMCNVIQQNIERDFQNNVIARWHDESHINRFALGRKDYRLLDPSYMYDEAGMWSTYEDKITILRKENYIAIDNVKHNVFGAMPTASNSPADPAWKRIRRALVHRLRLNNR